MTELELTEEDIAYIIAALHVAEEEWGSPDAERVSALADKFIDLPNRSLCDDKR